MTERAEELKSAYTECLKSYVSSREERWLETAATLGRRALSAGLGIIDVALMHHASLDPILTAAESAVERRRVLEAASLVLCELLGRYEMTHRGFVEMSREISEVPMIGVAFCRELQTPYQSIVTSLGRLGEIMAARPAEAERRLLGNMVSSTEILGQRIVDLTELVGFRTGILTLDRRNVDFREILRAAVKRVERASGDSADKLIRLEIGAVPRQVSLDGERVTEVLAALIDRTVASSSAGTPVEIRAFTENAYLIVELEGHITQTSLWDRMARILSNYPGAWSGREIAGLGSGLALCHEIVRFHRGHMQVESESGRALVRLKLPIDAIDR